ncbi:MAG: hypothetical protein WBF33_30430 [Candidatus Nitrosopolaris sp.]
MTAHRRLLIIPVIIAVLGLMIAHPGIAYARSHRGGYPWDIGQAVLDEGKEYKDHNGHYGIGTKTITDYLIPNPGGIRDKLIENHNEHPETWRTEKAYYPSHAVTRH